MGTYANTDPQVEAITCEILGLVPDTANTQVISRDRHADYIQTWPWWAPHWSASPPKSATSTH